MECNEWDPDQVKSPLQHLIPNYIKDESDTRNFAQALETSVKVEVHENGQADCYIDDLTTIILDIDKNWKRGAAAVLLAIFLVGRPVDPNDPIKRVDLVSLSKLKAEAALEEHKILLGWKLDTRALLISLPEHKFIAWSNCIQEILDKGKSNYDELESLIGRLGHVATIIQYSKHFMSRIRQLMHKSKNRRFINISNEVEKDLIFHTEILKIASQGISMNLLTYRKIQRVYRSDACPAGLGGYSTMGRAWRFYIPHWLQFRATLNMLEHLAAIIGPWIDMIEGTLPPFTCILSMTDSTTTSGWLRKSNFQESTNESTEMTRAKLEFSRGHALRMMKNKCTDYTQWFPGKENDVADSLSRDSHLSDIQLSNLYFSTLSEQIPSTFKISLLPPEITSFVYSTLLTLPEATQQHERHKHSSVSRGLVGTGLQRKYILKKIPFSLPSTGDIEQSSYQHLPNASETESLVDRLQSHWSA